MIGWTKTRYYKTRNLAAELGYLSVKQKRNNGRHDTPDIEVNWHPNAETPCPKKKDTAVSQSAGYGAEGHLRDINYKYNSEYFSDEVIDADDIY